MDAPHSMKRQVAAGIFQQHRLVNHGQLQVRGGIVHRDAPGLRQQHNEQRGKRQHMRRVQEFPGRALSALRRSGSGPWTRP